MPATFTEFKNGVLALYETKRSRNELDDLLANPTPANLRDYCLVRVSEGLSKTDTEVLQKFFDPYKRAKNIEEAISTFNTGSLKALQKFTLSKTQNPEDRIVKLLAILVDYQPRPFQNNYIDKPCNVDDESSIENVESTGKENPKIDPTTEVNKDLNIGTTTARDINEEVEVDAEEINSAATNPENMRRRKFFLPYLSKLRLNNKIILFGTLSIILVLIVWNVTYLRSEDCMCWNGERYVEVNCADKTQRYQIIGLNKQQLDYFERIQRKDTLSVADVGRVWYSKIDNEVEFFTQPGLHPVNFGRSLKLATEHIINKYAGKNANTLEDKSKNSTVE
ncbi:hypothetical protein [Sphingobacterium bambusae]|uniref:Uncharacterized protein n=1 Tax=Sphingobacterium bambusae TaxID=662858 RepID=A0ABW6BKA5_9SPHI|nr:hypothetical protein [Sphingobacterium bambusae]WPL47870.1 hypothetical protein SCB77_18130 [Sphingobacterium bambusae]